MGDALLLFCVQDRGTVWILQKQGEMQMGDTLLFLCLQNDSTDRVLQKLPYRNPPVSREGNANRRHIVAPLSGQARNFAGFAKTTLPAPPPFPRGRVQMGDTLLLLWLDTSGCVRIFRKLPYRHTLNC